MSACRTASPTVTHYTPTGIPRPLKPTGSTARFNPHLIADIGSHWRQGWAARAPGEQGMAGSPTVESADHDRGHEPLDRRS